MISTERPKPSSLSSSSSGRRQYGISGSRWRTVLFVVVVSVLSIMAFSIFGFQNNRDSFKQAITPVREKFKPLQNDARHLCRVGVDM